MSDFGLKRDDFKGRPGYRERPARVWRTGVGYVDSYEWRYRAPKQKRHRRELSDKDLGAMLKEGSRKAIERQADIYGYPGEYGVVTDTRRVVEKLASVCPECGFNRYMGRCTCGDST